jgi:lipid-A-disaccharide synthase
MPPPLIWLNACEPSGDLHAALLARALREQCPDIALAGMGGPAMAAQQVDLALRMEELSVMGISEVIAYLPRIVGMWRAVRRELMRQRPQAIVVVDSPDFHFRVVRMAAKLGIPVYYYISPQVWAWRQGRVKFLRAHVRRILCILPFEPDFYRAFGVDAEYVGHPLADVLLDPGFQEISPLDKRIGLLPGSRKSEIQRMMPVFAQTAANLLEQDPEIDICVFLAPGVQEKDLRRHCPPGLPLTFLESTDRYAAMRSCKMLLATSGTVTLESALLGIPTIVAYQCSRLSFLVGIRLVHVPAISLANLILGRNVLPEFIQHQMNATNLSAQILRWLSNPDALPRVRQSLARLPELLQPPQDDQPEATADAEPGADAFSGPGQSAHRAARIILRDF